MKEMGMDAIPTGLSGNTRRLVHSWFERSRVLSSMWGEQIAASQKYPQILRVDRNSEGELNFTGTGIDGVAGIADTIKGNRTAWILVS
jgi:hypothetical protein